MTIDGATPIASQTHSRERTARARAERVAEQTRRLQLVTAHLSHRRPASEVAETVLRESAAALGGMSAALCLLGPEGDDLRMLACVGYDQPDRLARVARRGGESLERFDEPLVVNAARLVRPIVVELVEDPRGAGLQRHGRVAAAKRRLEAAGVDVQAGTVERDRVARRHDVLGGRAKRAPQLTQGRPQARTGGVVEDVGPEAGGDRAACVLARMQREPRQQSPRAAARGHDDGSAVDLGVQLAEEEHPQHGRQAYTRFDAWLTGR